MEKKRLHLLIEGRVQGVWYRESTRRKAVSLGVCGWVRNRPDGTVEAVAEGDGDAVARLAEWCRQGPAGARVEAVGERAEPWTGEFNSFEVVY